MMDNTDTDRTLLKAALEEIALQGWHGFSLPSAASRAGVPLAEARARMPNRVALLMRLGAEADRAALAEDGGHGTARERLFDSLMRRIDVFQEHRAGVVALLRALPTAPLLVAPLAAATGNSMAWVLGAAGLSDTGIDGLVRTNALVGVWLYTLRAWERDDSVDLAATMAALDRALDRAARWVGLDDAPPAAATPMDPGPVDPLT